MNCAARKTYTVIQCKSACHRVKGGFPYVWDLNSYRGCIHGCRYCYALYSHGYIEGGDFYRNIYVKGNIVEQLERQLSRPNWKREVINLGGVTDSYQAIEAKYRIMPEILKLLIKYKTPAIISTKSDLVLKDFDLIDELSRITYINIAATVITLDQHLQNLLEPGAVQPQRRFAMLKEFRKTNASTGLHMMPIIPFLTDCEENIRLLFAAAKDSSVDYILPGTLYLRGQTKPAFLSFVRKQFPVQYAEMIQLYCSKQKNKEYKKTLYQTISQLLLEYSLTTDYKKIMDQKMNKDHTEKQYQQMSLDF